MKREVPDLHPDGKSSVAPAGALARFRPPAGLQAWRLDLDGDAFALFETPQQTAIPIAFDARLTRAEAEVARLMAEGFSDKEIAQQRCASPRTVANQAASVLHKLRLRSRRELTALLGTLQARADEP